MSELHDVIPEAVEALRTYGCKVEPLGDPFDFWIVDGKGMSNGNLLALAVRLGLLDSPGGLQYAATMAKEPATVFELRKDAEVTEEEIDAAADAVLAELAPNRTRSRRAGPRLGRVAPHEHACGRGAEHRQTGLEAQHSPNRDAAGTSSEGLSGCDRAGCSDGYDRSAEAHSCADRGLVRGNLSDASRAGSLCNRNGRSGHVDAAAFSLRRPVALLGRVSILTHRRIAGWAWEMDAPDVPLWVMIAAEQQVIGHCRADQFREDLAIRGIGKAAHGFTLDLRAGVLLLQRGYEITVRRESDGAHLPGSPYVLKPVFPTLREW